MARRERGILVRMLSDIFQSLIPNFNKRCVGKDFYGTKYYEVKPRLGSSRKAARYFEPVNKNDFTQEIPAEWEAWLRNRRKEPPTNEEVEKNYQMILQKRKNAEELEKTLARDQTEQSQSALVSEAQVKGNIEKISENSVQTPGGFPIYEEYKQYGINYKSQKKE